MRFSINNRQSGLALITVLFIFALVSMLAMSMQQRQSMDIAQASLTFTLTQAQLLAISAEDIAKSGLNADLTFDTTNNQLWDSASELWNQPVSTQVSGAQVDVTIRDLQGLFNLNWLGATDPSQAINRFQRLINEVDPTIPNATQIAMNLKNWFIKGNSANYTYQSLSPAYRASEKEFTHPSELKLVEGVDEKTYAALEPYITALPSSTALNINTTHPVILNAWGVGISNTDSENVLKKLRTSQCGADRNTARYESTAELWGTPEITKASNTTTNPGDKWDQADFTVKSEYFSVLIRVRLDDRDLVSESIIRRKPSTTGKNDGFLGVVYRDLSRTAEDFSVLKIVNCTN